MVVGRADGIMLRNNNSHKMMSTNIVALPEDEFGDDEAGDNAPQCYLVDNHPDRADRWRFHRPSHVAATGSSQQDHFMTSSFHELIHYAIFSEHPSTNNNEILAIRGGGSTSTAATNDHHSETVNNFLDEGTASFNFAADTTAALVATTTTTTTDDLISTNYCDDYPDLDNYLNGGSELLDFDSDSLLHLQDGSTTTTPSFLGQDDWEGDSSAQQQLREYTLREWITASLRTEMHVNNNNNQNMKALSSVQPKELPRKYIMSALMIALKLTECILEAEKDEQRGCRNPIPLESIAPENVLIRARKCRHISNGGDEKYEENEAHDEMIEFVWVMSFVGEKSATGTVMSRLFAMGRLLYEILSSHEPQTQEVDSISFMNSVNLGGINEDGRDHRPQKRSYRRSAHPADDNISNLIARLESMGVPWSLCLLMKNLLNCQHGSLSEDDAYTSFTDLLLDLKLMVEDPSCFLDNCTTKLAIQNKLYGRDYEMKKVEELYQHHVKEENKKVNGVIISGAAGVGKSTLAKYLQVLTSQSNRYFVTAKFEHNQMSLKPLSTLSNMFDTLCGVIFENSSRTQLMTIEEELTRAIGSESYLLGIVPSLRTLMPSSVLLEASTNDCVDATISMRFLFAEVLHVLSTHSKPITLLIDDIQYADHTSLLLVAGLLFSANQTSVFFAFCHRDDEVNKSGPFHTWLSSISILSLETIHLEPLLPEVVNDLISETLHLSPRMTRPLSSVLYHKTRGNPLFLKQLLISLTEQGYIYFDWNQHRWAWESDKIMELKISDSVLALLMDDIERLSDDMKFGLQVASCIGSHMTEFMLACLSKELGLDLIVILRQLSQKGFMVDIAGAAMFRFAHDRIQQAAYEMMPNHVRKKNHMRFGLALCNHTLNNGVENEELFFAVVNQINQGGLTAVQEPSQASVFAQLNLRAGRRSIDLSDYNTAYMMFRHGLAFLGEGSWTSNYRLSLELHDSLTEVAMILNKPSTVEAYTEKVILHARCFDDKLNCLCTSVQALAVALEMDKSIQSSFGILFQFGEELPRDMADAKLQADIDRMTFILQSTSDELIYNMQENNDKKLTALFNLYVYLAHALLYFRPWLFGSVSLRMMEITMKTGLCAMSPLAFAHFGSLSVTIGYVTVGCRLGKIALKFLERKGSSQYKSKVISFVYDGILWAAEPLQSIVDSHLQGYKTGQLSGDIIYGLKNVLLAITTDYVAGQNLDVLQKNILDFVRNLQRHGVKLFMKLTMLLLSQIMVLKDGLHMSRTSHLEGMPTEVEILADASSAQKVVLYGKVHRLTRAILFRQMEDGASIQINISHAVAGSYHQLDPIILLGYFFEGLASFLFVRRSMMNSSCIDGNESSSMMERGLSVLKRMRCWSEHSCWNWEDKRLLLEAEHMYTLGEYDRASSLYDSAIRSAHDHKFLHGEAIASELTGIFYHERGLHSESYPYFVHSAMSYKEWGAHAISERVEILLRDAVFTNAATVANTGGTVDILTHDQLSTITDSRTRTPLGHLFSSSQGGKKKRDEVWEP